MKPEFTEREEIHLSPHFEKMLISGWSEDVLRNTVTERIVYLSDGYKVKGYLSYPKNSGPGDKLPCIMWNRGGMKNNGVIDSFTARGIFGQMASWGYVVFASMYRGSVKGEGVDEFGGAELNDITNLMTLAEEIPGADTSNWGMEGWSRGGMMTYLTLMREPNIKCAVLVGEISDPWAYIKTKPELIEYYQNRNAGIDIEEFMSQRSALNRFNELPENVKYLLIHGGADDIILPYQSIDLARRFQEKGITYELHIYEGSDHFLRQSRKLVDETKRYWYYKNL